MRVLVILHQDLIPPDQTVSASEREQSEWKTEYDVVHGLKKLGHEVKVLGVGSDLGPLRMAIEDFKPKIVFNLLEEFAGEAVFDQNVVSYLELLGAAYTGCNPRGLMLARDKGLSKKILSYHRLPTPHFHVFRYRSKWKLPKNLKFPLFVKTLSEEASLGITQDSIVNDADQLNERIKYFFDNFQTDVIAESYIEGRELYVGMLGNKRLQVFPIWELHFNKLSERAPKIATRKVKWDLNYRNKYGITTGPAENLTPDLEKKIINYCKRAYRALELSGYVRMDLRLTETGNVYLIEANPNPDIAFDEDFAASALSAKVSYQQLLQKILLTGLR